MLSVGGSEIEELHYLLLVIACLDRSQLPSPAGQSLELRLGWGPRVHLERVGIFGDTVFRCRLAFGGTARISYFFALFLILVRGIRT